AAISGACSGCGPERAAATGKPVFRRKIDTAGKHMTLRLCFSDREAGQGSRKLCVGDRKPMFIDGRGISDGAVIETDIAIIGAGAAGISIAHALRGADASVALINSGGRDFEPDTQALYEGESVGVPYDHDSSRLRYFGGSTNHWGGWCRPFEPIDFEQRDWVPHSGWPITYADL